MEALKKAWKRQQSRGEEIANGITHGIGAGLSVAALAILVTYAGLFGDAWRVVSFSIYGATLIILYLVSTLYHSFSSQKAKDFFHLLDHSAIFLLIAGTYTPFTLVTLRGAWGWTLFGLIWSMAVGGILFKVFFFDRLRFVSVFFYVIMGWLAVTAISPLAEALSSGGLLWLALGGLFYTLGVIFYIWKSLPYGHMIWHLFVLAGSIMHFFCMLLYVLPMR